MFSPESVEDSNKILKQRLAENKKKYNFSEHGYPIDYPDSFSINFYNQDFDKF